MKFSLLSKDVDIIEAMNNEISFFPIPASNIIYYTLPDQIPIPFILNILDITGNIIETFEINDNNGNISIENLKPSVYIFQIKSDITNSYNQIIKY